jgi:arylsulfatase A-like enzyme
VSASAAAGLQNTEADRSPVVLIVIDTLRRDHLGCYGYSRGTSPHVDALAADAIVFRNAISHAPWTTPSIAALLSSRYPSDLGIDDVRAPLPEEVPYLAEALREAGYATGAVVSHSFCSRKWNFDQGFDYFDQTYVQGHDAITSAGVTAKALEFVEQHQEQPFFLWVHYFDPHDAFFDHESTPENGEPPTAEEYQGPIHSGIGFLQLQKLRKNATTSDVDELRRLYDSEIRYTDRHVGQLLARLRELQIYDKALIVFTADHGEEFLDHGRFGHTKTLFRELIDVPLLVKLPRGQGTLREDLVGLVDVAPTILEWTGCDPLEGAVGQSLLKTSPRGRLVFSETSRNADLRSVTSRDFKLVLDLESGQKSLFTLREDPLERVDVSAQEPQALVLLHQALQRWLQRETQAITPRPLELSEEERERLRQLGYEVEDEKR